MFSICNNVRKRPGWLSTQENSVERIYMKIEIPSSRLCSRQQRARHVRAYGAFYVNSYGNEVKCKFSLVIPAAHISKLCWVSFGVNLVSSEERQEL